MRKNFGAKPFLYPQPVMILGTYDENGKANAMNAAWGGIVGANEIIVDLSAHKTTDNIIKNKAFTVGVADLEHLVACDYVGIVSANKEADKMKKAGFSPNKTSSLKCANCGANSFSAFLPAVCTIFFTLITCPYFNFAPSVKAFPTRSPSL